MSPSVFEKWQSQIKHHTKRDRKYQEFLKTDAMPRDLLSNIPVFPNFKNLELKDKNIIEKFAKWFDPYSDHTFINLWISNSATNSIAISNLQNNLVIKCNDYITNERFYTFLGRTNVSETILTLLKHAHEKKICNELRLIPYTDIMSNLHDFTKFAIQEDRNNFDYIYSINELAELKGEKYSRMRKHINVFAKNYVDVVAKANLDLSNPKIQKQILDLYSLWAKERERGVATYEIAAIQRLFKNANKFNLTSTGIYDKSTLIAFSITQTLNANYALTLFEKADVVYREIYAYLNQVTAKFLYTQGIKYLNGGQDLGIEGLRSAKMLWHPSFFLKKYTISKQ